jgi:hypothetical protein
MSERWLRVRAVVSEWLPVVVVALVALSSIGGWAMYTAHVNPGTTTEQRQVDSWGATGEFRHSATVTRANPVYPNGTRLSNQSTYFTGISPALDAQYRSRIDAASTDDLGVSLRAVLVLQSVGENGQVFWRVNRSLSREAAPDVAPGEPVTVPFSVNVSRVSNRIGNITETLGGSPAEPSVFVTVDVQVTGTVEGRQQSVSFSDRLAITPDAGTYTVSAPSDLGRTVQRTETVEVPAEYGPLRSVGGPLLLLAALGGLGGVYSLRSRDELSLSDAERAYLEYRSARREFDEWITSFRLPSEAFEKPRAEASSLRDLVDFAIDTNAGVVEPPDESVFYVVGDEFLYVYDPPAEPPSGDATPIDAVMASGADDDADAE